MQVETVLTRVDRQNVAMDRSKRVFVVGCRAGGRSVYNAIVDMSMSHLMWLVQEQYMATSLLFSVIARTLSILDVRAYKTLVPNAR